MSLVQKLFKGKIDIVGDIHGEYEAFLALLLSLGYDENGNHPENRKLVFVGDLCDRGPDSPAVIKLVKKLIDNGNAQAILGNHELNLLQLKAKSGSGWYFKERESKDKNYEPFNVTEEDEKEMIYQFLVNLPLVLENDELRIVHATWDSEKIDAIRDIPLGQVINQYNHIERSINENIKSSGLLDSYHEEQTTWEIQLEDPKFQMPFLEYTSQYNIVHQMNNPMRVITSGVEQRCETPFYASGKWRFVERFSWWDSYQEDKPVIVGHFWRKLNTVEEHLDGNEENIFQNIEPNAWHGVRNNVFCVDFSVGGRFKERLQGENIGENTTLVALRWPENTLMLEDGTTMPTINFFKESQHLKNKNKLN